MRTLAWLVLLSLALVGAALPSRAARAADDSFGDGSAPLDGYLAAGQTARFIVPFMLSRTDAAGLRTATVVTATNQGDTACDISVDWILAGNGNTVCTSSLAVPVGHTVDFCSRPIPSGITSCNIVCSPALTSHEGRARVASARTTATNKCDRIAVSARVYYTSATTDMPVDAISDSKIVKVKAGNAGD